MRPRNVTESQMKSVVSIMTRLTAPLFAALVTVGCATTEQELARPDNFPPDVPRSAVIVDSGSGRRIFHATDAGRVYVYDADDARVVFTTHIDKDQRLFVEPVHDRATIDGRVVYEQNLAKRHTHRI